MPLSTEIANVDYDKEAWSSTPEILGEDAVLPFMGHSVEMPIELCDVDSFGVYVLDNHSSYLQTLLPEEAQGSGHCFDDGTLTTIAHAHHHEAVPYQHHLIELMGLHGMACTIVSKMSEHRKRYSGNKSHWKNINQTYFRPLGACRAHVTKILEPVAHQLVVDWNS